MAHLTHETRPPGSKAPLVRYVAAATLARTADGGAGLGLVLLAISVHLPAAVVGLLVAGLSAPHALGPWAARRLDAARDGRRLLAAATAGYGAALTTATLLLRSGPTWLAGLSVVGAGACGPLLTGGLSSRLAGLATTAGTSPRRAEGWDAVTYGLAGSAGPAMVAALTAVASPTVALLALSLGAVAAAGLTLGLPPAARSTAAPRPALTVRAALSVMTRTGPLRRSSLVTVVTAVPGGALPILAVALAVALGAGPGSGAVLAAVFGAGNLLGSLAVTARPQRGEPERLVLGQAALLAATYAAAAAVPTYLLSLVAFGASGVATAWLFTATLSARSAFAPAAARAQVFVTVAGLKVAAAALGTALAGNLLWAGPRVLLACGAVVSALVVAGCVVDRRVSPPA